ncbi:MAG TPA: DUF551 domain-containing protein, partial [Dehalococcoidia bacterium]|nr:DUF551 domain-containing protein [Dehalococcoidia bacterium]
PKKLYNANGEVSESSRLGTLIRTLFWMRCEAIRNNSGSFKQTYTTKSGAVHERWIRFGKKGSGDAIACSPYGRYIEAECKTDSGELSPEQQARRELIESKHGVYVLYRTPEDIEARKADILAKCWYEGHQWKPIETPPTPERNYLVFDSVVGYRVAYYDHTPLARVPYWDNAGEVLKNVTHWMPLPEGPAR